MAASSVDEFDLLARELSSLSTVEQKLDALTRLDPLAPGVTGIAALHADGATTGPAKKDISHADYTRRLELLMAQHGISMSQVTEHVTKRAQSGMFQSGQFPATLCYSPCANGHPRSFRFCPNQGKLGCSRCKVVGYCSKECQSAHWPKHKQDCRSPFNAADWKPAWVRERRSPSWMIDQQVTTKNWKKTQDELDEAAHLWGNMPAVDVLNITCNEGDIRKKDVSLAFAASGDLRNVMLTVNALPMDYTGKVTVVINDREPIVVIRNIVLLMLLREGITGVEQAADTALHLWYSAFTPLDHHLRLVAAVTTLLTSHNFASRSPSPVKINTPLGSKSTMKGSMPPDALYLLASLMSANYDAADAHKELQRVMFADRRRDNLDNRLAELEAPHRLAIVQFRRYGLLYPFGAYNAHFNTPNRLLFTPEGRWYQNDGADPLHSWDIKAVLAAGQRHGAFRGDLYGCLYFYLAEQLRAFAERIAKLDIEFHVLCQDASQLSRDIRNGTLSSIPQQLSFDRIEVSNIMDHNYLDIPTVISDWGSLLKKTPHATLLGSFMNWHIDQLNSSSNNCDEKTMHLMMDYMKKHGRLPKPNPRMRSPLEAMDLMGAMMSSMQNLTAVLDNSKPFDAYLKRHGLETALRRANLRRRQTHTIVPQRLCAPLDAKSSALPVFKDEEDWYLYAQLGAWLWSERYVEIAQKM